MPHEPDLLIGPHPQVFLEVLHGHPLGGDRHQIDRPKPLVQWQVTFVEHRASGSRDLLAAPITLKEFSALDKPHGLAAAGARSPLRPANTYQFRPAGPLVRETLLEIQQTEVIVGLFRPLHGESLSRNELSRYSHLGGGLKYRGLLRADFWRCTGINREFAEEILLGFALRFDFALGDRGNNGV